MADLNARAAEITEAENTALWARTPGSKTLFTRA